MTRTIRAVGLAACATAALLSAGSAAAAKPIPYDEPGTTQPASVVVREVQMPVDDTRNEVIQIILAAALGTCVAGTAAVIRTRRPHRSTTRHAQSH
jgi:hypothetical protein